MNKDKVPRRQGIELGQGQLPGKDRGKERTRIRERKIFREQDHKQAQKSEKGQNYEKNLFGTWIRFRNNRILETKK
jgi:hypothetical protein